MAQVYSNVIQWQLSELELRSKLRGTPYLSWTWAKFPQLKPQLWLTGTIFKGLWGILNLKISVFDNPNGCIHVNLKAFRKAIALAYHSKYGDEGTFFVGNVRDSDHRHVMRSEIPSFTQENNGQLSFGNWVTQGIKVA